MRKSKICSIVATSLLAACTGITSDSGINVYIGGGAPARGEAYIGPTYSFRFIEHWRVSHQWIKGDGINPCQYRYNIFSGLTQYSELSKDGRAPLFEKDQKIYFASATEKNPSQIVFHELSNQFFGEQITSRESKGKYTPFCGQFFPQSRNGIALFIIKPNSKNGTDEWIRGATPIQIKDLTWLVKKVPPKDFTGTGLMQPTEYWTLPIPDTPYWLHLTFSASLDYSIRQHEAESEALLSIFHQIVNSVKLEPITPIDPSLMPPFVIYERPPLRKSVN